MSAVLAVDPALFQQNLQLLLEPFPPERIEKKNGFDYVAHAYVTERLNKALGIAGWSFEIKATDVYLDLKEVHCLGRLMAHITLPDGSTRTIIKEEWGGQKCNTNSSGVITELANDKKGAGSDALKKCATLLGVALNLYMDEPKPARQAQSGSRPAQQTQRPAGAGAGPRPVPPLTPPTSNGGAGKDPGNLTDLNVPISEQSLKRMGELLEQGAAATTEVRDYCQGNFGKKTRTQLTEGQARKVIGWMEEKLQSMSSDMVV